MLAMVLCASTVSSDKGHHPLLLALACHSFDEFDDSHAAQRQDHAFSFDAGWVQARRSRIRQSELWRGSLASLGFSLRTTPPTHELESAYWASCSSLPQILNYSGAAQYILHSLADWRVDVQRGPLAAWRHERFARVLR